MGYGFNFAYYARIWPFISVYFSLSLLFFILPIIYIALVFGVHKFFCGQFVVKKEAVAYCNHGYL